MRVSLVFKPPVGVRRKVVTVSLYNNPAPLALDQLKELWVVERTLCNLGTRVELVVVSEQESVSHD